MYVDRAGVAPAGETCQGTPGDCTPARFRAVGPARDSGPNRLPVAPAAPLSRHWRRGLRPSSWRDLRCLAVHPGGLRAGSLVTISELAQLIHDLEDEVPVLNAGA